MVTSLGCMVKMGVWILAPPEGRESTNTLPAFACSMSMSVLPEAKAISCPELGAVEMSESYYLRWLIFWPSTHRFRSGLASSPSQFSASCHLRWLLVISGLSLWSYPILALLGSLRSGCWRIRRKALWSPFHSGHLAFLFSPRTNEEIFCEGLLWAELLLKAWIHQSCLTLSTCFKQQCLIGKKTYTHHENMQKKKPS